MKTVVACWRPGGQLFRSERNSSEGRGEVLKISAQPIARSRRARVRTQVALSGRTPSRHGRDGAPLLLPQALVAALMRLYDYPHPYHPGRTIRGYDCAHAIRTARMCAAVAIRLGHPADRVIRYQIACLLHDLGRAGLDRTLFGKIWSWAKQ